MNPPEHFPSQLFRPSALTCPLEVDAVARREFQDPGILIRPSRKGPEYYIRYRVRVIVMENGQRVIRRREKWVPLGLVAEMTEKQAERKKAEIMREVNGQVYDVQAHIPFSDFLDIYTKEHFRAIKETSQNYYRARIDKWILPALKDKKLYQISPLDISQLLGAMEDAKVARSTRKATRSLLTHIFTMAKKWGYLKNAENPAADAEIGRSDGAVRTKWTPSYEEAMAVIAKADDEVALVLELIIWTGMRISEVLGLRSNAIDVANRVIYIRERIVHGSADTPKSKAGVRTLPIDGRLAERLAARLTQDNGYVFNREGGYASNDTAVGRRTRDALAAAGLRHTGNLFHAFRRLHLTMVAPEMHNLDLMEQAGHADLRVTKLYVQDSVERRREAIERAQEKRGAKVVEIRKRA